MNAINPVENEDLSKGKPSSGFARTPTSGFASNSDREDSTILTGLQELKTGTSTSGFESENTNYKDISDREDSIINGLQELNIGESTACEDSSDTEDFTVLKGSHESKTGSTVSSDEHVVADVTYNDNNEQSNGYKRKIRLWFRYLKGELIEDCIIDLLFQNGKFTTFDVEDICALKKRYKRVDLMLRKLLRKDQDTYEDFLQYLTLCGYDHVRKKLEEPIPKQIIRQNADTECMNHLKNKKDAFVEKIEPDVILDYLMQHELFSIDDYEDIIVKDTRKKKAERIYEWVIDNDKPAYDILITSLEESRANDLLKILSERKDIVENTKVKSSRMNVELRRVKNWESREMNSALKDSKDFQLHIRLKGEGDMKKLEIDIIQELDDVEVRVCLNDTLIVEKQCTLTSVENGSIVITIRRCKKDSFHRLFGTSIQDPILQILRHVFLQPGIRKLLHRKAMVLEVELHYIPNKKRAMTSDVIETHFDYLVEELDAFPIMKSLFKNGFLTEEEFEKLKKDMPSSRIERMKHLLKDVQKRRAQNNFLEILKKDRKYVWDHISQSEHKKSIIPSDGLIHFYQELAANMNPSLFIKSVRTCIPMESIFGLNRNQLAKYILQDFLKADSDTKLMFLYDLFVRDQIPKSIQEKENSTKGNLAIGNRSSQQVGTIVKTKKTRKKRKKLIFSADYIVKEYPAIKTEIKQAALTPRTMAFV